MKEGGRERERERELQSPRDLFQVPISTQERDEEVKQLQERHSKEMNELMQTWIKELRLLGDRLLEKTEANSALSCQLEKMERQTEMAEGKLKSQVTEEIHRIEQIIHLQRVSVFQIFFFTIHPYKFYCKAARHGFVCIHM